MPIFNWRNNYYALWLEFITKIKSLLCWDDRNATPYIVVKNGRPIFCADFAIST